MGDLIAALAVVGFLLLILRLAFSSGRFRLTARLLPRADRGFGTPRPGTPWPRGAARAAIATAPIADLATQADTGAGLLGVVLIGAVAAVLFRSLPAPTGAVLGIIGSVVALAGVFVPVCTDPAGLRTLTVIGVVVAGLALFGVAAVIRATGLFVYIRTEAWSLPLAAFGIIELGAFVGGPFGLELTGLTGFGGSLVAVIALYLLICAGAGFLPDFTTSVLSAALLAAHVIVDFVIGDPCSDRRLVLPATLAGFVIVWALARRLGR